jgi:hypothetical protein
MQGGTAMVVRDGKAEPLSETTTFPSVETLGYSRVSLRDR